MWEFSTLHNVLHRTICGFDETEHSTEILILLSVLLFTFPFFIKQYDKSLPFPSEMNWRTSRIVVVEATKYFSNFV